MMLHLSSLQVPHNTSMLVTRNWSTNMTLDKNMMCFYCCHNARVWAFLNNQNFSREGFPFDVLLESFLHLISFHIFLYITAYYEHAIHFCVDCTIKASQYFLLVLLIHIKSHPLFFQKVQTISFKMFTSTHRHNVLTWSMTLVLHP